MSKKELYFKRASLGVFFAICLFVPLFLTGGIGSFDFWSWMALNGLLLTVFSLIAVPDYFRRLGKPSRLDIELGILSAILLYGIFALGNIMSPLIFAEAPADIAAVYGLKNEVSIWRISLFIALVIGPAEEIFWRGFVQRVMSDSFGPFYGILAATFFYAFVHIGSFNLMLLLAALCCGLYWGVLYEWRQSLVLNIVSHVLWDLLVFVLFPFS